MREGRERTTDQDHRRTYKENQGYGGFKIKDSWIGQVGIWGQRHYQYLKENKPGVVNVMRMNGNLKSYLREVDEQAAEMLFQLVKQMAEDKGVDEAMNEMHSLAEVEAFSYGFRLGVRLMLEAVVPLTKGST